MTEVRKNITGAKVSYDKQETSRQLTLCFLHTVAYSIMEHWKSVHR